MLTTDSFTLPAGRSLRSLSPSARWTGRSAFLRCTPWAGRLSSQSLPLPRGEEEPGPEGAERGGYLPIPRRDARAGSEPQYFSQKINLIQMDIMKKDFTNE